MGLQAKYNKEQAKYSTELGKEMWDYTNFENQKKHLEAAGLNPALLYGSSGGGGGGGTSTLCWLPSVSADGVLSFAQSASTTQPTAVNIKGPKGDTGSQGIQGIQGLKGDTGEKGTDGINGTNGADGKSAYEVAVLNGYAGSQSDWLLSLKGEQGIQGIDRKSVV